MSATLRSLIPNLEAAIADGDAVKRMAMLRSVTTLFTGQASRLNEEQVAAFDTVIVRLAQDMEAQARAALSEQMADVANAPRRVLRDLAFDWSVAVAGPVLSRSMRLQEDDLIEIAESRGQSHLMAITKRKSLGERITDIIVDRGDDNVVRSVARNDGAAFSPRGYTKLVHRAGQDAELQATLQTRGDISPVLRAQLITHARERIQASLSEEFGAIAHDATAKVARTMTQRDDALLAAEVAVSTQARKGDLDEAKLAYWLDTGRETEALVALARLAGVPSHMAIQAYHAETYEPLMFLVRSVRFGWRLMKIFMKTKTGRDPQPEVMQGIVEAFQALSVQSAQRVVRFTATRDSANAINEQKP